MGPCVIPPKTALSFRRLYAPISGFLLYGKLRRPHLIISNNLMRAAILGCGQMHTMPAQGITFYQLIGYLNSYGICASHNQSRAKITAISATGTGLITIKKLSFTLLKGYIINLHATVFTSMKLGWSNNRLRLNINVACKNLITSY